MIKSLILIITFSITQSALAQNFLENFVANNITGEITDSLEDPEMVQRQLARIRALTSEYADRANFCEADLALSRQHQNYNELQSLRLVADINDAMGANLNASGWIPFDGSRVDYSQFDCDKVKERENLNNIKHTVIAGSRWAGLFLMCEELHRLKTCFGGVEDVMRDNGVNTYDLDRTDFNKMPSFQNNFIELEFNSSTISQ